MTEKEIKSLWSCLQSLKDCGEIDEERLLEMAAKYGLTE